MTIISIVLKIPSGFNVCVLVLQENRGLLECAWHAGSGVTHFFNLTYVFKIWPGCRDTMSAPAVRCATLQQRRLASNDQQQKLTDTVSPPLFR